MNERFFELKKDRQDQIINGAMRVFAENGYRHASTDEMVAAAGISKGLLFHYFKSKKGTFQFLYEYGSRYALIEMREAVRRAGCDFFEMYRLLAKADAAILKKYPFLLLYLKRADRDIAQNDPSVGDDIPEELRQAVPALRWSLIDGTVKPPFLSTEDTRQIIHILEYARDGLMRELLTQEQEANVKKGQPLQEEMEEEKAVQPLHEEYTARFNNYIHTLRKLNL